MYQDFIDYTLRPTQRATFSSPSSTDAHHDAVQSENIGLQRSTRAPGDSSLNLGDLDEIIAGLSLPADATSLSRLPIAPPAQIKSPLLLESDISGPRRTATHRPPSLSLAAMTPRPPTLLEAPLPCALQGRGVTDLGVDANTRRHCFRLPLPADVDKTFTNLQVTVRGERGFRLDSCVGLKYKDYPNSSILKTVDHAEVILDDLIPGPDIIVQRSAMPDERLTTRAYAAVEKEPLYGFTLAHLLTIICRKQHDAWYRMARHEPGKPQESLRYEWMWIVSIARSDGTSGPVRWFPEIEVRVPREHWDVPATPQLKALSPPSTPHRDPRFLPQTPPLRPTSGTGYSPYPSPHKTQPQRPHSDRLHKRSTPTTKSPSRTDMSGSRIIMEARIAEVIFVPLPEDIHPRIRYPIYTQGDHRQGGVCLHNISASTRSDRLLEYLRETVLDADMPLIMGEEVNRTIVERAFFPGEIRGRAGRPVKERNDSGCWTLADILLRIMLKQREWYRKDIRTAEVQHLVASSKSPVWSWWSQRGMHEDMVWIVAVRQTLPDHQGQTRWVPEIELRDR